MNARSLNFDTAQMLAIAGLARIGASDTMMTRFSAVTGILPNEMRQAASDPAFLVGVLDFYLSHEPDLLAWAEDEQFSPEDVMRARIALAPDDTSGLE